MLEVLQSREQFEQARRQLRSQQRSAIEPAFIRLLRRWHLVPGLSVGEQNKSWDVMRTLELIDQRLPKDAAILDLGAYCSEVPVALAMAGYSNVHGIDLDPGIARMPAADKVRYTVGDFKKTNFADGSFDAITAISVIEHGYEPHALFAEIGRLLRPGGLFIASFDYWPQKIDTGAATFFGLSWLIFSEGDFQAMLQTAAVHGLSPLGEINAAASACPVRCAGFDYTFAWTALRKS